MGDLIGVQSEQLIGQLTRMIRRWRLEMPAILFLEVTKPFSFIASQGLLLCEPLLSFLYEEPRVAEYADLLSDRSNLEHLIACLEGENPRRDHGSEEKA